MCISKTKKSILLALILILTLSVSVSAATHEFNIYSWEPVVQFNENWTNINNWNLRVIDVTPTHPAVQNKGHINYPGTADSHDIAIFAQNSSVTLDRDISIQAMVITDTNTTANNVSINLNGNWLITAQMNILSNINTNDFQWINRVIGTPSNKLYNLALDEEFKIWQHGKSSLCLTGRGTFEVKSSEQQGATSFSQLPTLFKIKPENNAIQILNGEEITVNNNSRAFTLIKSNWNNWKLFLGKNDSNSYVELLTDFQIDKTTNKVSDMTTKTKLANMTLPIQRNSPVSINKTDFTQLDHVTLDVNSIVEMLRDGKKIPDGTHPLLTAKKFSDNRDVRLTPEKYTYWDRNNFRYVTVRIGVKTRDNTIYLATYADSDEGSNCSLGFTGLAMLLVVPTCLSLKIYRKRKK